MGKGPRAEIVKWPQEPAEQWALLRRAADLIKAGQVVAFPTDTVYGIGAYTWNEEAVQRLYEVKERPGHKAIALLLSGLSQLSAITDNKLPQLERLARNFWPGGLTIVVPWREDAPAPARQSNPTVGIRVPDHPIPRALIAEVGIPLATTSANLSGARSAVTAEEVSRQIGDRIAMIIDGGPCPGGQDSTVVDLTTDPFMVRRVGAIPVEKLEAMLGPVRVAG